MSDSIDAYPLCWPAGWPKHNGARERGSFSGTPAKVRQELIAESDRMLGARPGWTYREGIIISTNVPLRRDGEPFAKEPAFIDPGVAVYFTRKGKQMCFACDKYDAVWKNMRAIAKTIEAMRGIERWGSSDMLDRAFTGFAALPAPGPRKWHDVMGIAAHALNDEVRLRYKQLARERHPDTGGSHELFTELGEAWQSFQRERGLT